MDSIEDIKSAVKRLEGKTFTKPAPKEPPHQQRNNKKKKVSSIHIYNGAGNCAELIKALSKGKQFDAYLEEGSAYLEIFDSPMETEEEWAVREAKYEQEMRDYEKAREEWLKECELFRAKDNERIQLELVKLQAEVNFTVSQLAKGGA